MKNLLLGILFVFFSTNLAYAFNLSFLDYSPAAYFTPADWKMAESTALKALNKGVKMRWQNPQTGAQGYFIPSNAKRINGNFCRTLTSYSEANHYTGRSSYLFCKINGDWKIVK